MKSPLSTGAKFEDTVEPALVWGLDFTDRGPREVDHCTDRQIGKFRWLHLNLASQATRHWLGSLSHLPVDVRELLLSLDTHQRALIEREAVGCILHDFEREFDRSETDQVGGLRLAIAPGLIITARIHPVRSPDIVRERLRRGGMLNSPAEALEVLVSAITENVAGIGRDLVIRVQRAEDSFLAGRGPPSSRDLVTIRRRFAQLDHLIADMRDVFHRMEHDEDLPEMLQSTVEKLAQRLNSLTKDIRGGQSQLRLLREEIDMQQAQRTNQNLYILSIVTTLMLPATLVTGLFGMNTGGMPFSSGAYGTLISTAIALGTAGFSYLLMRWMGFMRR